MAIRYVDRWESPALKPVNGADCFAFRIDDIDDYNALPTPTTPADVVEGAGTVSVLAGVGSEVLSQIRPSSESFSRTERGTGWG